MVASDIERRVLDQVSAGFEDTLTFLRAMVREPSMLGNERGVQDLVFARLNQMGLAAEMWDLDPESLGSHPAYGPNDRSYVNRPNVTARWRAAGSGGHSVIFNGHIDVVSPEPMANWTHGPWDATVEGDWLYGRGAGDMKGGVAGMLLAVEAVRRAGCQLCGDVIVESVIEEECSGNGTLACGVRGLKADTAIIPEPRGLEANSATVGIIWFRVRTRGRASHVKAAHLAVNAIEKMIPVIAALRELEAKINAGERPLLYRDIQHPINLNVGILRGGDWPSTVPSECVMEGRYSCFPGVTVDEMQGQIRETVAAAGRGDPWLREHPPVVEFFGFRAPASVLDTQSPPMELLKRCHTDVTGTPLVFRPSAATTDERYFMNFWDTQAASYGPRGENGHAGDERVFIPSIEQLARVLALFIVRWCGVAD